ncbi:hypothetical protein [Saccharopolyspora sp. 5N708]|uniref:hypothetical protein n=1 Tax=Saccharopolyspora sp. 5N708 TaxID=3457424 RepID=UPI003FD04F8D
MIDTVEQLLVQILWGQPGIEGAGGEPGQEVVGICGRCGVGAPSSGRVGGRRDVLQNAVFRRRSPAKMTL